MRAVLPSFLLIALTFSGCAGAPDDATVEVGPTPAHPLPGFGVLPAEDAPVFSPPLLLDEVRAGGEPVIAITHEGTILVAAHPGWTHLHPTGDPLRPGAELLLPANGQSYLWRSEDGGKSWAHVGLPGLEAGPRGPALGVSDPDLTVMEDGTICYTDLLALAESGVACSQDDGRTWLQGNPASAGGPNDRQWLASAGPELYFTANYFVDHHLRASTDHGLTWEDRGDVPCAQDLVASPATGHLLVGCDAGVAVSEDGGRTWSGVRSVPDAGAGGQRIMAEPAVDAAGNVWVTYTQGERRLHAAGSPDEGQSWPWVLDLTPHFRLASGAMARCEKVGEALVCEDPGSDPPLVREPTDGTYIWPWISAGGEGRFAVTWIGAFEEADSASYEGPWYVFSAHVLDATGTPTVAVSRLTPDPMHVGPICQSGTTCQATSLQGDPSGDRRLGDFFETTIDAEGFLHASWTNTRQGDAVGHPEYVRQTGGVRLLEDQGAFVPTQG